MTSAASADPFVSLRSVSRRFGGVRAVDDVSIDLCPAEVHCLAGENGSGKSTLIKLIAGVLRPHGGTIRIGGRTLTHLTPMSAVEAGIQVIYQDLSLFPNLTVAENLALNTLLEHRRWFVRWRDVRAIADRALATLDVALELDRPLADLPIAERQLVAIARALVQDAKLVILDEPTTALDVIVEREILEQIRALQRQLGFAVLFITHDLARMLQFSDRVAVFYAAQMVEVAPAAELRRAPRHPYTQALLRAFPSVHGDRVEMSSIPGTPPSLRNPPAGCRFHPRCDRAVDLCRERPPELRSLAPGHAAACHLAE